jgi:hypothetical protein
LPATPGAPVYRVRQRESIVPFTGNGLLPVDGTGAAINLNQTAAQAATSMNCTLTVPTPRERNRHVATPLNAP